MGLETAAILTTVAATGVTMYAQSHHQKSANALTQFNADQRRSSGRLAKAEAEAQAQAQRKSTQKRMSTMRAIQGGRGVVGIGSALEALVDEESVGEMEALEIERQGRLAEQGFNTKAEIIEIKNRSQKRALKYNLAATGLQGSSRAFTQIAALT